MEKGLSFHVITVATEVRNINMYYDLCNMRIYASGNVDVHA